MHSQNFARLEEQALGTCAHLDEVGDSARLAADLDDVAAPHGERSDFDAGGE
ncbi:hypothetical protein [Streptomyces nojiriensis]|uniref:hypothetical protein n=1 Tax=Streptomyces nojiriensis TaxID=66374 RepID=UPI00364B57F9